MDRKTIIILILVFCLVVVCFFWFKDLHKIRSLAAQYDGLTVDELSWIIAGRMEALSDDFDDLIEAIVRQKMLTP